MKEDQDRAALGGRIREARTYRGFSQEDVARYLGVSRSSVSLIESGQRGTDTLELTKLSDLFECAITDLVGGKEAEPLESGTVAMVARATRELSPEDRDEVLRFAEFLRARRRRTDDARR